MIDINCTDVNGEPITSFTQWDVNQTIYVEPPEDAEIIPDFHFCSPNHAEAMVMTGDYVHVEGDRIAVKVPNALLQEAYPITVYVYVYAADKTAAGTPAKSVAKATFEVKKRPKPSDYEYYETIDGVFLEEVDAEIKAMIEEEIAHTDVGALKSRLETIEDKVLEISTETDILENGNRGPYYHDVSSLTPGIAVKHTDCLISGGRYRYITDIKAGEVYDYACTCGGGRRAYVIGRIEQIDNVNYFTLLRAAQEEPEGTVHYFDDRIVIQDAEDGARLFIETSNVASNTADDIQLRRLTITNKTDKLQNRIDVIENTVLGVEIETDILENGKSGPYYHDVSSLTPGIAVKHTDCLISGGRYRYITDIKAGEVYDYACTCGGGRRAYVIGRIESVNGTNYFTLLRAAPEEPAGTVHYFDDRITIQEAEDGARLFIETSNTTSSTTDDIQLRRLTITGKKPLSGLKLSILGDSASTFSGYMADSEYDSFYPHSGNDIQQVSKTWWGQLLTKSGMTLLKNASWAGSCVETKIGGPASDTTSTAWAGCSDKRIADLCDGDTKPDIVICFIGANDMNKRLIETTPTIIGDLGAWGMKNDKFVGGAVPSEGELTNFSEAYALMVSKIVRRYPEAEIFCCTMLDQTHANFDSQDTGIYPTINCKGYTVTQFNTVIKNIAAAFGVNIIDMHSCGLTYFNLSSYVGSDGLHKNMAGAAIMAEKAYAELLSKSKGGKQK